MSSTPLVTLESPGLYCESGGFHIDPMRAVDVAVVTHAHSDHAKRGSKHYICEASGVELLKERLGQNISVEGIPYGKPFQLKNTKVSFHPAGHILGSAQARIESEEEVWVASGDYKRDFDPSCEPFETVKCDVFITEATFGTPKYTWEKNAKHGLAISEWWKENAEKGFHSVLFGYSLGKAQRILAELEAYADKPVYLHSSMVEITECYRRQNRKLAPTLELSKDALTDGSLILCPPSSLTDAWAKGLKFKTAFASGWMQAGVSAFASRLNYDAGFVISDHADWNDLIQTIKESQAKRVFVQHRSGALIRVLKKMGIDAFGVEMLKRENLKHLPERNLTFSGLGL